MSRDERDELIEIAASLSRLAGSAAELLKEVAGVLRRMKTEEEFARSK